VKTLGPRFSTQNPETFHLYAKEIAKHQGIKRPEAVKTKTRKAKTPNGKPKSKSRSKPSSNPEGEAKTDVENIKAGGWADESGDKFLFTFPNKFVP
jgi:hypothetical protein